MTDSCTVTRPSTAAAPVDPVTGVPSFTAAAPIYSGVCRLKTNRIANPDPNQLAGDFPLTNDATFSAPSGAAQFRNLDIVVITASQLEPWNVGKRFRITSPQVGSQKSADRWQAEVITG